MTDLPADLLAAVSEASVAALREWWSALSDEDRCRIGGLWDERLEVRFFSPQVDETGRLDEWDQVPEVTEGSFVDDADCEDVKQNEVDYFDFLLSHPDLVLAYEPVGRTFHIGCTQHATAKACLAAGVVPATFICPLREFFCPLERLRGTRLVRAGATHPINIAIRAPG
jgi:hypothetical protein